MGIYITLSGHTLQFYRSSLLNKPQLNAYTNYFCDQHPNHFRRPSLKRARLPVNCLSVHPAPDVRRTVSSASNSCAAMKLPSGRCRDRWTFGSFCNQGLTHSAHTCRLHDAAAKIQFHMLRMCARKAVRYRTQMEVSEGSAGCSKKCRSASAHTQHLAGANGRAAT